MTPDADVIADCVLDTFDKLPAKRKPRARADGAREWVPLAAIVLVKDGKLSCVSLGTGMKCLPSSKLPLAHGNILHDWHAEVLATRTFNRFLLDQCLLLLTPPHSSSQFIRQRSPEERTEAEFQPFTIEEDVQIHMYCSEAPCGDASMELVMEAQEDATPWTSPVPTVSAATSSTSPASNLDEIENGVPAIALRGRSHFSHLGAVRCKPSRPDAQPTLSKSCTDKLAFKQATSLLSSLASLLISPRNAYLHSLIIPRSQLVPSACERAFSRSGRVRSLTQKAESRWGGEYAWHDFEVRGTQREFAWSRRTVGGNEKAVPSNLSAVRTPGWEETLIGGVLQGRKQFDPRGASSICRRSMWKMAVQIAAAAGAPMLVEALGKSRYKDVKEGEMLAARRKVKEDVRKEGLKGWITNAGDDGFGLKAE